MKGARARLWHSAAIFVCGTGQSLGPVQGMVRQTRIGS